MDLEYRKVEPLWHCAMILFNSHQPIAPCVASIIRYIAATPPTQLTFSTPSYPCHSFAPYLLSVTSLAFAAVRWGWSLTARQNIGPVFSCRPVYQKKLGGGHLSHYPTKTLATGASFGNNGRAEQQEAQEGRQCGGQVKEEGCYRRSAFSSQHLLGTSTQTLCASHR